MDDLLGSIGFENRAEALGHVEALLRRGGAEFVTPLGEVLAVVANPDRAVVGLQRYLEASIDAEADMQRMLVEPKFLRMLAVITNQSYFLLNIICRSPELIPQLWCEATLDRARTRDEFLSDLLGAGAGFRDFEDCCRKLRQFRRREILRIAVRDIVYHAPMDSVTEDLSNLADATLEAAFHAARDHMQGRFGVPMVAMADSAAEEATFVVLAMGKLGGRELNFSSDVDLLFLYSDEGETVGKDIRSVSNAEYFGKLGELLIKAIGERTEDGIIFRVDMRLRPYGRSGPLAVGVNSAVEYYGIYGHAWERQALIKVRPCAGDVGLGEVFIGRIRPFVFQKYFDDETLEDIRQNKAQMEALVRAQGHPEIEVKLGPGGIRDIEFTVQMLQLLNGGHVPALRGRNTLDTIGELGRQHYLSPMEAQTLARNYVYLRQIEHRLQIEGGQQRHALPEEPRKLDEFGRRFGYEDGRNFMAVYADRASETRKILEHFVAEKGSGDLWVGDLLNPHSDGSVGLAQLQLEGFEAPERSRAELLQLAMGTEDHPFSIHVRHQFMEIAPSMIRALSQTRHPDATLLRLGQILHRISAPGSLYGLLKWNPDLCYYLVTLVSNSEYLCDILTRDPGLFELLGGKDSLVYASTRENLRADLARLQGAVDADAALYRLRDGEMLRIAMRELVRHNTVAKVGDELTLLGEVILENTLGEARAWVAGRHGPSDIPFAVLGLGKLGGLEMGYGSDMDLIFVYEAEHTIASGMSPVEYFSAVASRTIQRLKEHTRYGTLYDVDARLRPDGNTGSIAVNHRRFEDYYLHDAQPWERLALMKVRSVGGDAAFTKRVEEIAREAAFSLRLDPDSLGHIESLRKKLIEKATALDIKKQEGGILDIEFMVRYWQLMHVKDYPELKRGDVLGVLDILSENGLVDPTQCITLRKAYTGLRKILNRIRMMDGGGGTELPGTLEQREELAGRLGLSGDLLDHVCEHKAKVTLIYQQVFNELLGAG